MCGHICKCVNKSANPYIDLLHAYTDLQMRRQICKYADQSVNVYVDNKLDRQANHQLQLTIGCLFTRDFCYTSAVAKMCKCVCWPANVCVSTICLCGSASVGYTAYTPPVGAISQRPAPTFDSAHTAMDATCTPLHAGHWFGGFLQDLSFVSTDYVRMLSVLQPNVTKRFMVLS